MFIGKIDQSNKKILLGVLERVKTAGINGLIHDLFPPVKDSHHVLSTNSEYSCITLDFLFYNKAYVEIKCEPDILCLHAVIKPLLKSESFTFITGVCVHQYAKTNQYKAQLLPSAPQQGTRSKYANININN